LNKWVVLVFCLLMGAIACEAQYPSPAFTVYGGYDFTHTNSGFDMSGFDLSGAFRATNYIYLKGDFTGGFNTSYGNSYHLFTYTGGPQYSFRAGKQIRPFAEVLVGGATFSAAGASQNAFAAEFGGGLDINRARWGLRVIEVDYLYTHFGGTGQNNVKISTGLLLHF